jgi:hypothetical protein
VPDLAVGADDDVELAGGPAGRGRGVERGAAQRVPGLPADARGPGPPAEQAVSLVGGLDEPLSAGAVGARTSR